MPRPLTQMTADDVRALILGELRWPPDLPIVEVEVEERVDSVGDDALYVTLIPPNELPEEVLASDEARELRSAVSRLPPVPRRATLPLHADAAAAGPRRGVRRGRGLSRLAGQLLEQAERLAALDRVGRPRQANLRRAVSSAYYSLFHLLVDAGCRAFVGTRSRDLRHAVARGFDHGTMMTACKSARGGVPPDVFKPALPAGRFSPGLVSVAELFVLLQDLRHDADYNLASTFGRAEVATLLRDTRAAHDTLWPAVEGTDEAAVFLWMLLLHRTLARR